MYRRHHGNGAGTALDGAHAAHKFWDERRHLRAVARVVDLDPMHSLALRLERCGKLAEGGFRSREADMPWRHMPC
jgi:hypothetical protein